MKKKITIVVVTYQTNRKILLKCLKSINKNIKVIIIENSKKFENEKIFKKKFKNLEIICSGSNLGYGNGNNLGLSKVKTKYALILNPDAYCSKNFFKNLEINLNNIEDFHLLGCTYSNKNKTFPAGFFNNHENKNFEKIVNSNKLPKIVKVDWIRGFSIVLNMKKFKKRAVFDKNYFLYLEEIDLCKSIQQKLGNVYFANNLKVQHLGFKGSVGASKINKRNSENLRNWHYMWSSFYFYKKNYGYFYALNKMFGKFIRAFLKLIIYSIFFQRDKKEKYLFRFLGLLSSMIGLKSNYRVKKFY